MERIIAPGGDGLDTDATILATQETHIRPVAMQGSASSASIKSGVTGRAPLPKTTPIHEESVVAPVNTSRAVADDMYHSSGHGGMIGNIIPGSQHHNETSGNLPPPVATAHDVALHHEHHGVHHNFVGDPCEHKHVGPTSLLHASGPHATETANFLDPKVDPVTGRVAPHHEHSNVPVLPESIHEKPITVASLPLNSTAVTDNSSRVPSDTTYLVDGHETTSAGGNGINVVQLPVSHNPPLTNRNETRASHTAHGAPVLGHEKPITATNVRPVEHQPPDSTHSTNHHKVHESPYTTSTVDPRVDGVLTDIQAIALQQHKQQHEQVTHQPIAAGVTAVGVVGSDGVHEKKKHGVFGFLHRDKHTDTDHNKLHKDPSVVR